MTYKPNWKSLDNRKTPKWFHNGKFGIFIHWGVYSVPSYRKLENELYGSYSEWYEASVMGKYRCIDKDFHTNNYGENFEYRDFAPLFKAELFNPDHWAKLFSDSGAKYVVLTAKHHDGYCLWKTDNIHKKNWNSYDVGPKRDLVNELTKAVRKTDLKMGLYYSSIDWETNSSSRPEGGFFIDKKMVDKYGIPEADYPDQILIPQLKELVTKYQPAVIFADGGEWDLSEEYSQIKEFLAWLYNNAPNKDEVVVNDRFCVGMPGKHGDYFTSEYNDVDKMYGDQIWEENRGIGSSYGFNRAENLENYNSSKQLIIELIDIVSRGGNLLLNVGPAADGRIPVIMQERLLQIGSWLKINGEAIFDTTVAGIKSKDGVYFTKKEDNYFAISDGWPNEKIEFKFNHKVKTIKLLGYTEQIDWKQEDDKVVIFTPNIKPHKIIDLNAIAYKITI